MNDERLDHLFRTLGIVWRAVIVVLIVGLSILFIRYTIPLIYPFIFAWLIALAIEPLVRLLERWRIPRWGGTTLSLVLVLGVLSGIITLIIVRVVNELTRFVEFIQKNIDTISESVTNWFIQRASTFTQLEETIQKSLQKLEQFTTGTESTQLSDSLQNSLQSLAELITRLITKFISGMGVFLGNLPYLLMVLVFVILGSFFISKNWSKLTQHTTRLLPTIVKNSGGLVLADLKKALVGFIRAQLTLITLTAIIVLLGLMILRVNYALTIALIIGLVDLLPYLGVGAVMVPWIIYLFIVGNLKLAIGLSVLYVIIIVVRNFLEPKVYASNIGLDPLVTLIALFVGFKLFGVLGLVIGPTATVIFLALYRARVFHDTYNYIIGKPSHRIRT